MKFCGPLDNIEKELVVKDELSRLSDKPGKLTAEHLIHLISQATWFIKWFGLSVVL